MDANADENKEAKHRLDPLILLGAIVTSFLALNGEPWWTLTGATASRLLSIQISPYNVQIAATGLPPSLPFAQTLGSITRFLVVLGFLSFAAASVRPTAWWRNLAIYFGLSTLAELYLSFLLMYHAVETALVSTYGVVPPYSGSQHLAANILGLDLNYYINPIVTASFTLPFYLGLFGLVVVTGRLFLKTIQDRVLSIATSFLGGGVREIYLTPPYQHIWLSTGDRELNPLVRDPELLSDDELLVSFEKLYKTVEPGGRITMILPAWATSAGDRFQKLIPDTGFTIEKTGIVYRVRGKPEIELRFRKPIEATAPTIEATEETAIEEPSAPGAELAEENAESEEPPVIETSTEPSWIPTRMTRLERTILKSAVSLITSRQEPVPYRELLNEVYMELVDKRVDFESARQIEETLLEHSGRELAVVEETDETSNRVVRKWWLGEQKITPEGPILPFLRRIGRRARPRMPKASHLSRKWQRKPRYRPSKQKDQD